MYNLIAAKLVDVT